MKTIKYILILFVLFLVNSQSNAQPISLTESSRISLLTCAPGQDLYSAFGHSAIRIQDKKLNIDSVYNYGTFDFSTPYFYLKFARGNLNYMLNVSEYRRFAHFYFKTERSITELVLNLNLEERQKLFVYLINNAKPENKYYRYDFFFDNCATRIRDVVFDNIDGSVVLHNESIENRSFRNYCGEYLNKSPWVKFGIDLLLGVQSDFPADAWYSMYLPDYLEQQFEFATVEKDSTAYKLISQKRTILDFNNNIKPTSITPSLLFWILCGFILITTFLKSFNLFFRIFDQLLFVLVGIVGLLITYLWFFALHSVTDLNYNLIWASPLQFIILFSIILKWNNNQIIKKMTFAIVLVQLLLLTFWLKIPQEFPDGLFPLVLIIFVRNLSHLLQLFDIRINQLNTVRLKKT